MDMVLKFKWLQDESCPACNAKIRMAKIHNQHSSGEWNESIEYRCGASATYCPNFPGLISWHPCDTAMKQAQKFMQDKSRSRVNNG